MWRYGLIIMGLAGLVVSAQPVIGQQSYVLEFSLDIGSDCELSDPNIDGDEAFDPGDVYWWDGTAVLPPGQNGQKDDSRLFGFDPAPDPAIAGTLVPVGGGGAADYPSYFDLDAHDQLDFDLQQYVPPDMPTEPIFEFPSATVFAPAYLLISYDDDMAPGWPAWDVPVTQPSSGGLIYGMTGANDEVIQVEVIALAGWYQIVATTAVADEMTVHPNLQPNPDNGDADDDDVDSLDIVESPDIAPYWLFSADHEATMQLDPGDIYQASAAGGAPVKVVDHAVHLGLRDGVDIDAFEFVWMELAAGMPKVLTLLFSVDQDDPLTPVLDESGGLDPKMIYYSHLTGGYGPLLLTPLDADVDALTNWFTSLVDEEPEKDWGDAPDFPYPTLKTNGGANHVIVPNLFLGFGIDAEGDGQPSISAIGDDLFDGNDDEDGVTLLPILIPNTVSRVTVVATGVGLLQGWIDFNDNGLWSDPGDQIITNVLLGPGPNFVNFNVPAIPMTGVRYARFRFSTAAGIPFFGPAPDGEVEDYAIPVDLDWGDAPDPTYPTLLANNGAVHQIVQGFHLGASIDAEADGQPHGEALGDDNDGNDDGDGVVFLTPILLDEIVKVAVTASAPGILQAWIDYNIDGDWDDADEYVIVNAPLNAGLNILTFTVPRSATSGTTFMRFRFSTGGNLPVRGPAPNGEVEDYQVSVGLDWGDAPDLPYLTLKVNSGASHILAPDMFLGAGVDGEFDGQPTPGADGDDILDGNDDEDGVTLPSSLVPGQLTPVVVTASQSGFLQGWIDFNADGDWLDSGEQIIVDEMLGGGMNNLSFTVPAGATAGTTYARFRFSSVAGLAFWGQAPDGEVEDYVIDIEETPLRDWGDAPDQPYPTLAANAGAFHFIMPGIMLGARIDSDPDGQPTLGADGDDLLDGNDDEDGVMLPMALFRTTAASVVVTATAPGFLQAWVDFNGNGSWADAGDQVFVDVPLNPGPNILTFNVPAAASNGQTYLRFRYSTIPGVPFFGLARDGEVEDYRILLTCLGDADLDGDVDLDDFVILKNHFGGLGSWGDGDFDGDGDIDLDDFVILKLNFGC